VGGQFDEELCFGESFGMISAYFKRPVRRTVIARTAMELYALSKDDFLKRWQPIRVLRTASALPSWPILRSLAQSPPGCEGCNLDSHTADVDPANRSLPTA